MFLYACLVNVWKLREENYLHRLWFILDIQWSNQSSHEINHQTHKKHQKSVSCYRVHKYRIYVVGNRSMQFSRTSRYAIMRSCDHATMRPCDHAISSVKTEDERRRGGRRKTGRRKVTHYNSASKYLRRAVDLIRMNELLNRRFPQ
jgi:hypothetical protein